MVADLHVSSCFARFVEENICRLTAFAFIFRQMKIAKNSLKSSESLSDLEKPLGVDYIFSNMRYVFSLGEILTTNKR